MIITKEWVFAKLPKRPKDANKGTFGRVLVIAGSENYPGAAYLCCAACYRVGAGLVTLVTTKEVKQIVSRKLPEVTFLSFDEVFVKIKEYDVLLLGPGLGQEKTTVKLTDKLLTLKLPKTVIDGDGLNILSSIDEWWRRLKTETVLTPHPGEMGRLTSFSLEDIQKNREEVAKNFSKKWSQVLVLKGADTIIVSPTGEVRKSPFANPLLATAGTGDVLAGMIAGMMAQGLNSFDAACVTVYLHGLAGEKLKEQFGDGGALASELLQVLPLVSKQLKA